MLFQFFDKIECLVNATQNLEDGMNKFLKLLDITFRRDRNNYRPRINRIGSGRDQEQKAKGNYFYLD